RWPRDWSSDVCSSDLGSGERRNTSWGSDLRNTGGANYGLLTPTGTTAESLGAQCGCTVKGQVYNGQFLLDRAQLVGKPIHRVDRSEERRVGEEWRCVG